MNTSIEFLPIKKQQELRAIVQAIRQYPNVEMVILFGSYARNKWVEEYAEDDIHLQYQSDLAKEDYDYLLTKARNFYELFEFSFIKSNYSEAAFFLRC